MFDFFKLYVAFAKVQLKTQLEYRMDYFIRTIGKIFVWGSGFVTIIVVLSRFKSMGEWSYYEVLFIFSLNILAYAIGATFIMGSFGNLARHIVSGEFDSTLTKPVNPLAYFICRYVSAGYTSNYALGFGMIIYCIIKMNIRITVGSVLLLLFMILCSSIISGCMFMICSIPAFWLMRNNSITRLFFWNAMSFVDYPISIYSKGIQVILTFILPYAFVSYYPATLLFNPGKALFSPILAYMTPVVAIILCIVTYGFWTIGINSYKSSGS
jgi:ABC-2 type transport system permease protein